MDALPNQSTCNTACDAVQSVNVPGAAGVNGSAGTNGTNGVSAFTTLTAGFVMPAELATVTIAVQDSSWAGPNMIVFIPEAGFFQVVTEPDINHITIKNLADTPNSAYLTNAPPTQPIAAFLKVCPAGLQGPSGTLIGATAGGDLEGTYPNPTTKVTTTKGDLIVNNNAAVAPRNTRLAVGSNGKTLHANSAQATGLEWRTFDLTGGNSLITGALPIANGGTGQAAKAAAFDALSPVTTRGDIIIRSATTNDRLAVGAASRVLTSNGTDPSWGQVTAAMMAASAKFLGRYGLLGSFIGANFNTTADQAITMASSKYIIRQIVVTNPSVDLSAATIPLGGIYTNAAKAGTIIVAAAQSYAALTAATKFLDLTLTAIVGTDVLTAATTYLSLSTAHGSAATADLYIFGEDLS